MNSAILETPIVETKTIAGHFFYQDVNDGSRIWFDNCECGVMQSGALFLFSAAHFEREGQFPMSMQFTVQQFAGDSYDVDFIVNDVWECSNSMRFEVSQKSHNITEDYDDIREAMIDLFEKVQAYETLKQSVEGLGVARSPRRI